MTSVTQAAGTVQRHPYRPELALLRVFLAGHGYTREAAAAIVGHAEWEGTLEGAPGLEPADMEGAEMTFVDNMDPVPSTSYEWDEYGEADEQLRPRYTDLDSILEAAGMLEGDRSIPADAVLIPPELEEEDPFEPSPEDWADYHAWAVEVEARRLGILPISGGGPEGPTDDEKAEALGHCRRLDALAELRAAEARAPMYGYE